MNEPAGGARPRRVLFAQQYPDGGSVTSLALLVSGLRDHDVEPVVVLAADWPARAVLEAAGARVIAREGADAAPAPSYGSAPVERRLDGAPVARSHPLRRDVRRIVRRDLPHLRWWNRLLAEERPDLVHANNDFASNRAALVAAGRHRIPTVVHLRGLHEYETGVSRTIDRVVARRADAIVAISEAVADQQAAELRLPRSRIAVVDNPFDLEGIVRPPRPELREELGVTGRRIVLLVARLTAWKGHRVLIDAMAQLDDEHADVVAVVVGGFRAPTANRCATASCATSRSSSSPIG